MRTTNTYLKDQFHLFNVGGLVIQEVMISAKCPKVFIPIPHSYRQVSCFTSEFRVNPHIICFRGRSTHQSTTFVCWNRFLKTMMIHRCWLLEILAAKLAASVGICARPYACQITCGNSQLLLPFVVTLLACCNIWKQFLYAAFPKNEELQSHFNWKMIPEFLC